MPRVEKVPGVDDVLPAVIAPAHDLPARSRRPVAGRGLSGDEQPPSAPSGRRGVLRPLWMLGLLALIAALVVSRLLDTPTLLGRSLAASLGVVLALGLAVRTGTQVRVPVGLALLIGVSAAATGWPLLLAAAAFGTAVLAAALAVLATRPAPTSRAVVLEVVVALLVATAGGLGVAGFSVRLDAERFAYTVLCVSFLATVALVYRLGGGLHALGRRGLILAGFALVLLVIVLVYTAALTQYGSPTLVAHVRTAETWTLEHLGGVPRPVEVLVGIPALAWGVSMRSRRRQGWWVCAFGTAATAAGVSRLIYADIASRATALSALYTLVLGLLVALVLIRLEDVLTSRSWRGDVGAAHSRHEPTRLQTLH